MPRRPPADARHGGGGAQRKRFVVACAALFLASCANIVDAAGAGSPNYHPPDPHHQTRSAETLAQINRQVAADDLDDAAHDWAGAHTVPQPGSIKSNPNNHQYENSAESSTPSDPNNNARRPGREDRGVYNHAREYNSNYQNIIIPNDASALATLAPAKSVRAPPAGLRPTAPHIAAPGASGLASPQNARSLADWEVEDFILLATVDGDLHASDRKTGQKRWHLEVEQPMIETVHHRANVSALDEDFHPVDHYVWAVEPGRDGKIYVWVPAAPEPTLTSTGLTMKKLVEELAPHAAEEPPVAYLGEKKTAMITLDAATGRVLKWFGTTGSQVNDAESCFRPNAILGEEECSSLGTITLGRTEYTVSIQRRDGRPIATLKYNEWVLNTYDNDLLQQYNMPLDMLYITSQHDGSVYGFSHRNVGMQGIDDDDLFQKPISKNQFPSPVARVFDVCRPRGSSNGNNRDSELIILPQPPPPSHDSATADERRNSVFLNRTVDGGWYALSGQAYPLIVNAPSARIQHPDSWEIRQAVVNGLAPGLVSETLVGTHQLDMVSGSHGQYQPPTLPPGEQQQAGSPAIDPNNLSTGSGLLDEPPTPPTIGSRVKTFKEIAAHRIMAWVMNEVWIPIFVILIIVYHKELRRQCRRLASKRYWVESGWLGKKFAAEADSDSESEDKVSESPASQPQSEEASPEPVETPAAPNPPAQPLVETVEAGSTEVQGDAPSYIPPQPEKAGQALLAQQAVDGADDAQPAATDKAITTDKPPETNGAQAADGAPVEKKKKAHRGRRGGVKHRKKDKERDASRAPSDDPIEDAVDKVLRLREPAKSAKLEPDVYTMPDDMQSVSGPIIRMGNIEVDMNDQLGTGSNGTLVFAGKFDGRVVAVKRMLIQFYDIASQETKLLRESDDHPNVIRYFAQQVRDGFLYIALERCAASLADVIEKPHQYPEIAQAGGKDLPGVLLQITNGISHLHSLRIVHRDLKPQNILVNMGKDGRPRVLVSDFGLCKKLEDTQSSFGATTGRAAGTSGWRAPELLIDDDSSTAMESSTHSGSGSVLVGDSGMSSRRATRSIDIFSLGLVFFYVLTGGSHPFDCGDRYMREVNIRKDNYSLDALDSLGDFAHEAKDVIAAMLNADAKQRPNAREVMAHPFFWSAKTRLQFLCDVSDHFEKEPREPPSAALEELEMNAPGVTRGDFLRALPREFIDSLGKQRKYTGSRLLDLLRALRNKRNHYEDMPEALKRSVGPLPEGYLAFWTVRFPSLLLVCWNVVYQVGWDSADRFREYYEPVRT
ncbi:related to IRE1 - protein kinase [Cephalotrichum gorgonifer]|uniref:non-specific serine/threonine protein kinase n=1 Tax=Cephalotrichum gorgonifer TaxID=2041049 RepID=A0AAE8MNN9_9PEZI|nr:related to IRE1 - protein kinase [Cephalotrichum gorgonifer]